jgi:hypothetical protein
MDAVQLRILSYESKVYGDIEDVVFSNVNIFCKLSVSVDEPVGAILNE